MYTPNDPIYTGFMQTFAAINGLRMGDPPMIIEHPVSSGTMSHKLHNELFLERQQTYNQTRKKMRTGSRQNSWISSLFQMQILFIILHFTIQIIRRGVCRTLIS